MMPSYWMFCVLEFVHLPVVSPSIYFPFFCFFCWNFLKWDWMVLAAFSTSTGLRGGTGEAHVPLQALDSEQDRKQGIAREATAVEVKSAATIKVRTHAKHWSFFFVVVVCFDQFQSWILHSMWFKPFQKHHLQSHDWAYLRFLYTPMLFLLRPSNWKGSTRTEINPLALQIWSQLVFESPQLQLYLKSIACLRRHRSHTDDQTSLYLY